MSDLAANAVPWFDSSKSLVLLLSLCACGIIAWSSFVRSRRPITIRTIAGLQAVDDAIGRATEMARPLLFTPGWGGDIQRPTTIASLNLLAHVAERTATYDCDLVFPTHDPVIMTVAQEVAKEAYIRAGHPDRYRADQFLYTSSTQFGYAAAVEGMIARQRPASVFLLGTFEAESLIMAETGNAVGAIQIAGTDSTIQLSFFIVACDYTLIGEELFAASGYLSGNRSILVSVLAQDIMKVLLVAAWLAVVLWTTLVPPGVR